MSHFEYNITAELTPEFEEKTKELINKIDDGTAFYTFSKYSDEQLEGDKKQRTIVLTSQWNVWQYLFEIVKGCNATYMGYYKQRII